MNEINRQMMHNMVQSEITIQCSAEVILKNICARCNFPAPVAALTARSLAIAYYKPHGSRTPTEQALIEWYFDLTHPE